MKVAGKCPPEKEELEQTSEKGFENAELFVRKKHLDSMQDSIEAVQSSELEITSIHTPHVSLEGKEYFRKADRMAQKLDAFLVVHSQFLHHSHIPELEKIGFEANYGYENNPGSSSHHLRNTVFKQGHKAVLDTAHLFMAEENYSRKLRSLLEDYSESIEVMHLCDSIKLEDGLPFGEGDIDMEQTFNSIVESGFEGVLVLEVPPEAQEEALEKVKDWS